MIRWDDNQSTEVVRANDVEKVIFSKDEFEEYQKKIKDTFTEAARIAASTALEGLANQLFDGTMMFTTSKEAAAGVNKTLEEVEREARRLAKFFRENPESLQV